jgi:hypothetical protein
MWMHCVTGDILMVVLIHWYIKSYTCMNSHTRLTVAQNVCTQFLSGHSCFCLHSKKEQNAFWNKNIYNMTSGEWTPDLRKIYLYWPLDRHGHGPNWEKAYIQSDWFP